MIANIDFSSSGTGVRVRELLWDQKYEFQKLWNLDRISVRPKNIYSRNSGPSTKFMCNAKQPYQNICRTLDGCKTTALPDFPGI
jgi:hypothetical protein